MNMHNVAAEQPSIRTVSKLYHSGANETSALFAMREYPDDNGILDFKDLTDEKLVSSFVETQDEGAFNEIVRRYADKIYRTALRITRNPSAAEDVLQEVFIVLMEKMNTFHAESKFSTWLYSVTAKISFSQLRAEKKHRNNVSFEEDIYKVEEKMLRDLGLQDLSHSSDEAFLSRERLEIIEKAINELSAPYRAVFHLRDVEGLTNPEVAEILNLSLPNVKSRIYRARLFLRGKLSDYFY